MAQELSSGCQRVAGSIPPWACQSVPKHERHKLYSALDKGAI